MAQSTGVELVIQAVDKATASLNQINKSIEQTGKASKEANTAAGEGARIGEGGILKLWAAVELAIKGFELLKKAVELPIEQFVALFEFSEKLVRAFDSQFLAEQRLANAAEVTGNASSAQVKALIELDEQLEKTTRFQAQAIVAGQAMAFQFGATAETMPRVTQAALEMAQAAGTTVTEAFSKLDAAIQTGVLRPGGLFERSGFPFKRTGDQAKDLAAAVDVAMREFGGSVKKSMEGGAASIVTFDHGLESLEQKLGDIISTTPQFQGFMKTLNEAVDAAGKFLTSNRALVSTTFGDIFAASLEIAGKAAALFGEAIVKLSDALTYTLNLFDKLSNVIPGLESPFKKLRDGIAQTESDLKDLKAALDESLLGGIRPFQAPSGAVGFVSGTKEEQEELRQKIEAANKSLQEQKNLLNELQGSSKLQGFAKDLGRIGDDIEKLKNAGLPKILTPEGFSEQAGVNIAKSADEMADLTKQTQSFSRVDLSLPQRELEQLYRATTKAESQFVELDGTVTTFSKINSVQKMVDAVEELGAQGELTKEQMVEVLESMRDAAKDNLPALRAIDAELEKIRSTAQQIPDLPGAGANQPTGTPVGTGIGFGIGAGAGFGGFQIDSTALDQAANQMADAVRSAAGELQDSAAVLADAGNKLGQSGGQLEQGALELALAGVSMESQFSVASQQLQQAAEALTQAASEHSSSAGGGADAGGALISAAIQLDRSADLLDSAASALMLAAGSISGGGGSSQSIGGGQQVGIQSAPVGAGGIQVVIQVDTLELSDRAVDDVVAKFQRKLADKMLESVRRSR